MAFPFRREVVITARLIAGWSQAELAERAGVTTGAVSSIEQGLTRSPRARTVKRLADALGIPVETCYAFDAEVA
jgi:transcriptional regulator with XRE-family HTH domain